jgi:hypothetical protein
LAEHAHSALLWIAGEFNFTEVLSSLLSPVKLVSQFVLDVFNGATSGLFNVLEYGFLGLKVVAFLTQDFSEIHGPEFVYRRAVSCGALNFRPVDHAAFEHYVQGIASPRFATSIDRRLLRLNEESSQLANTGVAAVSAQAAHLEVTNAINRVRDLPLLILPEHTATDVVGQFQECLPEYRVETGVNSHPHPRVSAIRTAFRNRANAFLDGRNRPVRAVGASNTEMPTINRLAHNCWPTLSGRDAMRKRSYNTAANAGFRQLTEDHNMQACNNVASVGADIWSFFSAHDIPPAEFLTEMAASGSDTAVVALHLPFPLLDRRVTKYTDALTGLHYERDGDSLLVYHTDGQSAGYCHSFATVRSWMDNLPHFDNAHAQVEVLGQVGTAVLFSLQLCEGKQEVVPAVRRAQRDDFYILPEMLAADLKPTDKNHFAVQSRKFEQLVAYVATLDYTQRNLETIVPKIRGMLAEIRVGVHTVEPRWSITLPQMYSLAHHAVLAHDLHYRSSSAAARGMRAYYARQRWRSGAIWQRLVQGRLDLLCGRANGEADPLRENRLVTFFTRNRFDHTHVYNPYVRAGEYRLVNLERRTSDRLVSPAAVRSCMRGAAGKVVDVSLSAVTAVSTAARHAAGAAAQAVRLVNGPSDAADLGYTPSAPPYVRVPDYPPRAPAVPANPAPPVAPAPDRGAQPDQDSAYDASDRVAAQPLANVVAPRSASEPHSVARPSPEADDVSVTTGVSLGFEPAVQPEDEQVADAEFDEVDWLQRESKAGQLMCYPAHMCSATQPRDMDFLAPLAPVVHQHEADRQFGNLIGRSTSFRWPQEDMVVPCPTRGAYHLIEAAHSQRDRDEFPETLLRSPRDAQGFNGRAWRKRDLVRALDSENLGDAAIDAEAPAASAPVQVRQQYDDLALARKVNRFCRHATSAANDAPRRIKLLTIEGPPMCAKSSLARLFVKRRRTKTLVVVPSRRLAAAWKEDTEFNQWARVVVRHTLVEPRRGAAPFTLGVVDEVFNFSELELYLTFRMLAGLGVKTVLLLGDRFQREPNAIMLQHPYLSRRIEMHTSLGMPLDAHGAFLRANGLTGAMHTTTGTKMHSVFFRAQDSPDFPADLSFKYYQEAGPADVRTSVGQVQGSRARYAKLYVDMAQNRAQWLIAQENRVSVALTRHTHALLVVAPAGAVRTITYNAFEEYAVVGARKERREHRLSPLVADDVFKPFTSAKLTPALQVIRASFCDALALDGHHVVLNKPDPTAPEKPAARTVTRAAISEFVACNANFSLPDPTTIDHTAAQPRNRLSFKDLSPPLQRTDVRNDLTDSHLLAAIHVNGSSHDAWKNLLDRQASTSKSSRFGREERDEGVQIYRRFAQCFYADQATMLHGDYSAVWLHDLETAALANLRSSEPLGETHQSLSYDAEFKTQSKCKAQPGFAATLPYGQSILASTKAFNTRFASGQPMLYANLQRRMRPGAILDYGMTDEQLSDKLRALGVARDMNGPRNFQADVSKQDSSHSAAFLYAFTLIMADCGMATDDIGFYLAACRLYQFHSRSEDGTKGSLSFNLGSGDPFTLIRNNVMEMCTVACSFAHADTMIIVEKGDDVHGVLLNEAPHHLRRLPSVRAVVLKTDYGIAGYHAGRFHNGTRYLVDPVRAFLKHFTRLSDENVPNSVLHGSYASRATDYSEGDVDFLIAACQEHYPYLQSDHICAMIDTMISLRDRKVFDRYSRLRLAPMSLTVDTVTDCALNCVRALRPGRKPSYYRQFRGMPAENLVEKLRGDGIPAVLVGPGLSDVPRGTIAVSPTHARVTITLGREDPYRDL